MKPFALSLSKGTSIVGSFDKLRANGTVCFTLMVYLLNPEHFMGERVADSKSLLRPGKIKALLALTSIVNKKQQNAAWRIDSSSCKSMTAWPKAKRSTLETGFK